MKKILFIVNAGKISSDESGGASVYYSHLELLHKAGYTTTLLSVVWDQNHSFQYADYKEILPFVDTIEHYTIENRFPGKWWNRLYKAIFQPAEFEYLFINKKNKDFLESFVKKGGFELVWCEWRWTAIWAWKTALKAPVVYAHHDWEYKLALLRNKPTLKKRFHTFQKKRVEVKLVKQVAGCVSGSVTEAKEIEKIAKKAAVYIPTTYESVKTELQSNPEPNIVHLGGMGTTANRLGLERFLEVCWTAIKAKIPEVQLIVVGNLKKAHPGLLEKLKDSNIKCLGFVKDLRTVLHPEDIHIVPWEYNTGTRTRIPVALNYKQALVSTKAAASCYAEITNKNSILCKDLHEMTGQILNLYSDREKLHLLSEKGKQVFERTFTTESQVEKLKQFLNFM